MSAPIVIINAKCIAEDGTEFEFKYYPSENILFVFIGPKHKHHMTVTQVTPENTYKEMIGLMDVWNTANPKGNKSIQYTGPDSVDQIREFVRPYHVGSIPKILTIYDGDIPVREVHIGDWVGKDSKGRPIVRSHVE